MTATAPLGAAADRLLAATTAFVALAPRVTDRRWQLAEAFGTEPEASWGPPEVLAHVAEMGPFWLGEIERILDGPDGVPFGRTQGDAVRIGLIGRDRTVPLRELFARIAADAARIATRVRTLTAEEAGRAGTHPRLGRLTVAEVLERFLVTHLEEHVVQLQATLAALG